MKLRSTFGLLAALTVAVLFVSPSLAGGTVGTPGTPQPLGTASAPAFSALNVGASGLALSGQLRQEAAPLPFWYYPIGQGQPVQSIAHITPNASTGVNFAAQAIDVFAESGVWTVGTGSTLFTSTAGSSLSYGFSGTGLSLTFTGGSNHVTAAITLDGRAYRFPTVTAGTWTSPALAAGPHTVTVTAPGGGYLELASYAVTGGASGPPVSVHNVPMITPGAANVNGREYLLSVEGSAGTKTGTAAESAYGATSGDFVAGYFAARGGVGNGSQVADVWALNPLTDDTDPGNAASLAVGSNHSSYVEEPDLNLYQDYPLSVGRIKAGVQTVHGGTGRGGDAFCVQAALPTDGWSRGYGMWAGAIRNDGGNAVDLNYTFGSDDGLRGVIVSREDRAENNLILKRFTDSGEAGNYIEALNAAGTADVARLDHAGNVLAATVNATAGYQANGAAGLTTNVQVTTPSGTSTLHFTSGLLTSVTQP